MLKLPEKEAKSLSFLSYSLVGLVLFNYSEDYFTKVIDLIFFLCLFYFSGYVIHEE
jgi:hypothetical protein